MNHIYKTKTLLIGVFLLSFTGIFAQNSSLLYYLENLPQTNYTNPAMMPRTNSFFGLPGISSIAFNFKSDIAPKDLLQKSGDRWVHPLDAAFDYNKLYKSIGKSASVNTELAYTPIYFGFRTGNGYFTFSLQQKIKARFGLPQDLFRITEKGFDSGTILNLVTLETQILAYHELSIGYAHKIDKHLTVGVHIKPLSGIAAAQMKFNEFLIQNNRINYNMHIDGEILTSSPFIEFVPSEDGFVKEFETDDDISTSDIVNNVIPKFSNFGLALDLGAVYDLNREFSFSVALNNLGYINWKTNTNATSTKGKYMFTGPDISINQIDEMDVAYEEIADSVMSVIDGNTSNKSFSTTLVPELMLGSVYHVNHVLDLGFLSKSTFAKYNYRQEFVVSANFNLYKTLTTNIAYNHEIRGAKDLGIGLALSAGPAQLYILINNIPFYYDKIVDEEKEFIVPTKTESYSFMMGINIVLGKNGYRNKPMIER